MLTAKTPSGYKKIHDTYFTRMYRVGKRYLQSEKLAEDYAQRIFSRVFLEKRTFLFTGSFKKYLLDIAVKVLREMVEEEVKKQEVDPNTKIIPLIYGQQTKL